MTDQQTKFPEHSYIRRKGRMTPAQARAFENLTKDYSIEPQAIGPMLLSQADSGDSIGGKIGIEIGFGMGHALLDWATAAPQWQLFGIELYQPGIGSLMNNLHHHQVTNVRIVAQPAQQVLAALEGQTVDEIRIFFPDPWPKKRHFKRRLIQRDFVVELARVLREDGIVRLATDWAPYAVWMRECLQLEPALVSVVDEVRGSGSEQIDGSVRLTTNFERRGERLGHDICDLVYAKRR